jgi:hypothetical protein
MRTTQNVLHIMLACGLCFACGSETVESTPGAGGNIAGQAGQGGAAGQGAQAGNQNQAGTAGSGASTGAAGTAGNGGQAGQAGSAGQMGQGGAAGQGANTGQAGSTGMGGTPAPEGQQCGIVLKSQTAHSGVVYAAPFSQGRLDWYRVDGAGPRYENSIPLSSGTMDMLVDRDNSRLFVLHDISQEAVIYQITRPTSPDEPVFNGPQEMARISFANMPVRFAVDRIRNRVYTLTQPPLPGNGEPVREYVLEITDISNPAAPLALPSLNVPPATSIAIDSQRGLMFMYANIDETLLAFDVTSPSPRPLPEMTFDLEARFDEPSQTSFNIKGFRIDEERGMLYAARDQVPNSQALVFEYAPASNSQDGCIALGPFTVRTDPLDQSVPPADRTNLMGAAVAEPILGKGGVFFVFAAWNGSMAQSMVTMLDDDLNFETGCGDFETNTDVDINFGCFISGAAFDDKGVCVDALHQVAAVTVASGVSFFSFDANRTMAPPIVIDQGAAATLACH